MLDRAVARTLALALTIALHTGLSTNATAQTPGKWRYTIVTDRALMPADMQVNFPSGGFVRTPPPPGSSPGQGDMLSFAYACDAGQTLSGLAIGRVQSTRFDVNLESRYSPPVGGVDVVKQAMTAARIGACGVRPDSDLMRVK